MATEPTQAHVTEAHVTRRTYLWVFLWLTVLTAIEVVVAGYGFAHTPRITLLALLAVGKALLVALYYMHLRYDNRILALIGGFPFLLAVIMALIILADKTLAGGVVGG